MYGWHYQGWYWLPGVVMGVALFLLLVVVIVGTLVALRRYPRSAERARPPEALRILDERFARGEIDAEEYHRRREELSR